MKKMFFISLAVMIISIIIMGINTFILTFSDNVIRINGIVMLINVFVLSYSTVKLKNNN